MQLELRERVVVWIRCDDGTVEKHGSIRQHWHGPVTGASVIVDLDGGGWTIAPIANVRRPSESEA